MIIELNDYLMHYGTPRHSGRYPWGSGEDPQNSRNFLNYVADLKRKNMTEAEIARGLGFDSTTRLRAAKSIAKNQQKQEDIRQAQRLKDKGMSNVAIGQRMGINESSVRALLAPGEKDKADILAATSDMLKSQVEKKSYLDVGAGAEFSANVSRTKLNTAIAVLEEQGYKVHYVKVEQLGTGKQTTIKVLTKPDVPYSEVFKNRDNIKQITDHSEDGGRTYLGLKPPTSVSSKRLGVVYGEEGKKADGVIYVRPGAKDLSLGESHYAQVRIAVDGTHYLKGMAMYKNDLPDGVDLVFNTNKNDTGNKLDALKKLKDDPDNPFGAVISRQSGHMNIVNEEGQWGKWSKSLSSQMLSKQSPNLARTQLEMTYSRKKNEFEEIQRLTNPAVKKRLLESFADDVDSSAVHLKAAALPRQGSHVILPINSMKDTEIYAPNYRNGERVVLIRYPHGGKFEIPELTVNNRQTEAKSLLGNAVDAVGISHKVAERLSGADFDGDTVLVIPNNSGKVKSEPALEGLKKFDPMKYKLPADAPAMSPRTKQVEMGKVSNLITDMTIRGANNAELARAVRHSMVVIDAEKHRLDYKQSAIDNNIAQLKAKYQGGARGGASTLISNSGTSSTIKVPEFKARSAAEGGPIDRHTGEKVFVKTGSTYVDKAGRITPHLSEVTKLGYVKDAHSLSSGTPIEKIYADHSNSLKQLANDARKSMVNTKSTPYSPSAKAAYSKEVNTLNAKLSLALQNAPLERQAQILANATFSAKKRANPDMDPAETKKIKAQALAEARSRTGAKKAQIQITDDEWAAIQAGAISTNKLSQILQNSDLTRVKELATPRSDLKMTDAKTNRAKVMLASGYTQAEVADALGVSVTTLKKGLSGE